MKEHGQTGSGAKRRPVNEVDSGGSSAAVDDRPS